MIAIDTIYGPPPPPDLEPASAPEPAETPTIGLATTEPDEAESEALPETELSAIPENDEQAETDPVERPIAVSGRVMIFDEADEDETEQSPELDEAAAYELAFGSEPDPEPESEAASLVTPEPVPVAAAIAAPVKLPKDRSVAAARPSKPVSMTRKSRWKRRGVTKSSNRLMTAGAGAVLCLAVLIGLRFTSGEAKTGPDGAFAQAVYQAFPEADPQRIETIEEGDLPLAATLHLPAHLIESALGSDPFARLGAEFGGAERTLSGIEMAARVERVATAVLPGDLVRCHTYKVGPISSAPEAPRRTRALYLRLNPGC